MDPATGTFRQSEYETAVRIPQERGVVLQRSANPAVDWVDASATTRSAAASKPPSPAPPPATSTSTPASQTTTPASSTTSPATTNPPPASSSARTPPAWTAPAPASTPTPPTIRTPIPTLRASLQSRPLLGIKCPGLPIQSWAVPNRNGGGSNSASRSRRDRGGRLGDRIASGTSLACACNPRRCLRNGVGTRACIRVGLIA
jgi:hypothetical protein